MASPACCALPSCETCCRRHAWGPMPPSTCSGTATAARPTPPRPSRKRWAPGAVLRGSASDPRTQQPRGLVTTPPPLLPPGQARWAAASTHSVRCFPSAQALARMLLHFHSIPWMTYRTGFTPIAVGDVQLRSDAGWGCTLRRCGARVPLLRRGSFARRPPSWLHCTLPCNNASFAGLMACLPHPD